MRIRGGFVSNSSSSSFVLASDKPLDELTMTFTFKLLPTVESTLRTEDEVHKYAFERWSWGGKALGEIFREEPSAKVTYEKMIQAVREGKSIFVGGCSNEGYGVAEQVLFEKGFPEGSEDFSVIENISW